MSETSEKVIDKIIDNATSRLKIPIVSTYIIVLLVHNWDLVYYLLFQTGQASTKIAYIKTNYPNYWGGIFKAVGIAICVLILVSCLDLLLTYILKEVYKKKKKYVDEVNEYKTIDELINANNLLNETIAKLTTKVINLEENEKKLKNQLKVNDEFQNSNFNKNELGEIFQKIINANIPNLSSIDKITVFYNVVNKIDEIYYDENKKDEFYYSELYSEDERTEIIAMINFVTHLLADKKVISINGQNSNGIIVKINPFVMDINKIINKS